DRYKVATFYSISNCQPGLRGVSLGDFLIKRVAERLQAEVPTLKTFCTLSPIPGFAAWLARLDSVQSVEAPRVKPSVLRELDDALRALRERHGRDLLALVQPTDASSKAAGAARRRGNEGATLALVGGEATLAAPQAASSTDDDAQAASAAAPVDEAAAPGDRAAELRTLQRLCALYLLQTSPTDQRPSDPVARFHLNNGARL